MMNTPTAVACGIENRHDDHRSMFASFIQQ
jgi:hypothetical protein